MFVYNEYNGTFRANYPSFILNNNKNNETAQWIMKSGIPEKNLIEWSKQFLNANRNFVDIGAHMGTYTISLAPHCKNVFSFEAQKMTYYQLCGGIALNNLENVNAYNNAIGNEEESGKMLTLNITSIDGGGSSLRNDLINDQNKKKLLKQESVITKCLDDFNIHDIGLIKIDVEGYEFNVIKGAIKTIKNSNNPPILFETWNENWFKNDKNKTFELLESLGYNIININGYSNMFLANIK